MAFTKITVETTVSRTLEKIWKCWTDPNHVTEWNFASDDWACPKAQNDLHTGGSFNYRMEAKDGSFGFDFEGVYTGVEEHKRINYKMADDRTVEILFTQNGGEVTVTETFDAETQNSPEMQKTGWQAILDNFKKHVEGC